jgi:hypothetical protein
MKKGRTYGTTEVTEKDYVSSKRLDKKAETWGRWKTDSLVEDEVIFMGEGMSV